MPSVEIPSLLNYTRSIVPSEGTFWINHHDPLIIQEKTVLGTIANYSGVYKGNKQQDEEAINKQMLAGDNNIQRIDSCHLPAGTDTFTLRFSLKFLANANAPESCNVPEFRNDLEEIAVLYKEKGGFTVLAERYFANLMNGKFLWRNRYGTQRTLTLKAPFHKDLKETSFDIIDEPHLPEDKIAQFQPWINHIADAFSGKIPFFILDVVAKITIGDGQEVYPSQEFVDKGSQGGKGGKSKTLFSVKVNGQQVAALHSQKIGNAIRTIDTWYPDASVDHPLAVDPFTVDKRRATTVRLPDKEKSDFYSLLKNPEELKNKLQAASNAKNLDGNLHYFMAVLIRGGVFSGEGKKDKK
ncbi:type I-F CRISPR-associated protein Csy3 [Candidatus Nitrosacidococcus tergens]|uniref:CRISPR-associated protein, Csy3 family n=1 Tax=Candidatus Nitrosacidococcus tergens TaxID=553981 RepID=A0A7G1Q910_9GAMM|nr:type I-F CRISPR-associated protein Csy3 [Candidatus Nitrosacidococcus tergens]CAB1275395.1 CRISPR-associated protein, Csy3 family [Candidatus Nitrosacidococcus tergens]